MKTRIKKWVSRRLLLALCVTTLMSLHSVALSEEVYIFERMWPTLQEPWYFNDPMDIAVDSNGFIYVVDRENYRIVKLSETGQVITSFGGIPEEDLDEGLSPYFINLRGAAFDSEDIIYVLHGVYDVYVNKYTAEGEFVDQWYAPHAYDIAIDANDFVYLLTSTIEKFTPSGNPVADWELEQLDDGWDLDSGVNKLHIDNEGFIYAVAENYDDRTQRIVKYRPNGELVKDWQIFIEDSDYWDWYSTVTVDSNGSVYFGSVFDSVPAIRKYGPDGELEDVFSTSCVYGLAIFDGLLYGSDVEDHIQKLTTEGSVLADWRAWGAQDGYFHTPSGIAVDEKNGYVYVADYGNNRVQKFSLNGQFLDSLVGDGTAAGSLKEPLEITVDEQGFVYVVDSGNHRIQKFDADGTFQTAWEYQLADQPFQTEPTYTDIAVDDRGFVYVTDPSLDHILRFTSEGQAEPVFYVDDGWTPFGIAIDKDNFVYVLDGVGTSKLSPDGQLVAEWASINAFPVECTLLPEGIAVDGEGCTYVAVLQEWCGPGRPIRKYGPDGEYLGEVRGFGTSPGEFVSPRDVFVTSDGRIYVADTKNHRVQVLQTGAALYFPHIDTTSPWETEIALINTSIDQTVAGTLRAYSDSGQELETLALSLKAHARREITIGNEFTNHTTIGYLIFEADSDTLCGYTKFYTQGKYRVAVPAVEEVNTSDIYLSHIDSSAQWWTGVSLLNTTGSAKTLAIDFDTGQSTSVTLAPGEHRAFTIRDLFGGQPQQDIGSAVITNASGIVGLELFGSTEQSGGTYLSGILLKDDTSSTIYYPHIDSSSLNPASAYWTGIVAYNPSASPSTLTITPYSEAGAPLTAQNIDISAGGKYIGTVSSLSLPPGTAWFKIEATNPLTGFELFGTNDGNQLAGYTGVGISATQGVFAKIDKDGWTGIAFVNIDTSQASITLTAYDSNGNVVATQTLSLGGHAKVVDLAEHLFDQDISTATYIGYESDKEIVGFQLNGSSDGMMLDGLPGLGVSRLRYPIVDTGQSKCYNNTSVINTPQSGEAFYGQDAQHTGNTPRFTDNGDGTATDNVTGLMWQKSPDTDGDGDIDADDKLSYDQAVAKASTLNLDGYTDWRLPTIKELYSLIKFRGTDPSGYEGTDTSGLIPFIDTAYFDFAYGDTSVGERIIDAQYASSTLYVSNTANDGGRTMFGVNFADGRIKGYGLTLFGSDKTFFVIYARGNTGYGKNDYADNRDGSITDYATGLMWSQDDSGMGLNWEEALAWIEQKNDENYLGYRDWRLPNAKELQSIVDYTRSPDTTGSAAIDPLFHVTSIINEAGQSDYPFYWSSTTHCNWTATPGANGVYVAFGRAMGYMNGTWVDVHGAGAQRSDPKSGDPDEYPTGRGPQGDAIRIYNYVRPVRDADFGTVDNEPA